MADPAAAERIVQAVLAEWGRVDILVNNAGVIRDELFVRMEPDDWNAVIGTNLGGTFDFCKAVAKQMAFKQRSGRIINVSSVAAEHVNPGQANYAASKGAINAFTRALAVELASAERVGQRGRPGLHRDGHERGGAQQGGRRQLKKLIPMRRLGKPEDIAARGGVPGGPAAAYITGQVMTVDGGLSLGAVRRDPALSPPGSDPASEEVAHDPATKSTRRCRARSWRRSTSTKTRSSRPSRLKGDLSAESIDFLDIVFRLEREFGSRSRAEELFPESIFQGDPEFVADGKVTPRGWPSCRRGCPSPT